jgi:hypothetical protein
MTVNKHKQITRYIDVCLGSKPKAIYSVLAQKARNTNRDINSNKNRTDPSMAENQDSPLSEVNNEQKNT